MNIVLIGQTGSGKDYLLNKMIKDWELDKITTYTTRPIRSGEVGGETYHFVSRKEFDRMLENGEFMEHKSYNAVEGEWLYGTSYKSILRQNTVIILDRDGYLKYKDVVPHCVAIYISIFDDIEQFFRVLDRLGDNVSRKDVREAYRRITEDRDKFKDIYDVVDFTVPQIYNETTIDLVYDILKRVGANKRKVEEWQ
jgi:guanylate kinase